MRHREYSKREVFLIGYKLGQLGPTLYAGFRRERRLKLQGFFADGGGTPGRRVSVSITDTIRP